MKVTRIVSRSLADNHFRLDAAFHSAEGKAFQRSIERSNLKFMALSEVTESIFNGPRFSRCYIDDSSRGIRFLSSSDMLRADLSNVKLLSRKHTHSLEKLKIYRGWILVSCSGTIGNMIYCSEQHNGYTASQHIMRIVPNRKVLPGYLFAFLSSRYGKSMITQGTYGAVIQHIEPQHIQNLPVPILDSNFSRIVHSLTEEASKLRTEASRTVNTTLQAFGLKVLNVDQNPSYQYPRDRFLACEKTRIHHMRLDGYHNIGYCREGRDLIKRPTVLGTYVKAYQPPIFKRPYVKNGIPFMSGMDLYDAHPQVTNQLSRKMIGIEKYIVDAGTILVQNVGQRYGLFGRPVVLHRHLDKSAVTQHLTRIYPRKDRDKGFVYFFLLSEIGRRCLLGNSFGTSMGVLFKKSFLECPCPETDDDLRAQFNKPFVEFVTKRDQAIAKEKEAVQLVEQELSKWLD